MKLLGISEEPTLGRVNKKSVYEQVNDMLISQIEEGIIPWRQPWASSEGGQFMNYRTKKPYTGVNPWIISSRLKPHHCAFFATSHQIEQLGGELIKDATRFTVVYYGKAVVKENGKPTDDKPNGEIFERLIRFLKEYTVYNLADTTGIDWQAKLPTIKLTEGEKIENCEKVYELMPKKPKLVHGGNEAYYQPSRDLVKMPTLKSFTKPQYYYSTLFHELIHSTGSPSRLKREKGVTFGDKKYAFEELIAEIGAAYICAHTGILLTTKKNSAGYLQGWLKALVKEAKENKTFFFRAASASQKAANYILSKQLKAKKKSKPKSNAKYGAISGIESIQADTSNSNTHFTSIDRVQSGGTFSLPGELGKFLPDLGNHECSITLEGDQGAGKSQLGWMLADAFADMGKVVAFISTEMSRTSPVITRYRDTYIKPQNQSKVLFNDDSDMTAERIGKLAKNYDVVIVDSFTKLAGYDQFQFTRLFKSIPDKIVIGLFQRTTSGEIRGGNTPVFDAYVNIEVVKVDDTFKNNYAVCTKNRFGATGDRFNISQRKVMKPQPEVTPKKALFNKETNKKSKVVVNN